MGLEGLDQELDTCTVVMGFTDKGKLDMFTDVIWSQLVSNLKHIGTFAVFLVLAIVYYVQVYHYPETLPANCEFHSYII